MHTSYTEGWRVGWRQKGEAAVIASMKKGTMRGYSLRFCNIPRAPPQNKDGAYLGIGLDEDLKAAIEQEPCNTTPLHS